MGESLAIGVTKDGNYGTDFPTAENVLDYAGGAVLSKKEYHFAGREEESDGFGDLSDSALQYRKILYDRI